MNNIPILVFSGSSQHTPDTQHATNGGGQGGPDVGPDDQGHGGRDGQGQGGLNLWKSEANGIW